MSRIGKTPIALPKGVEIKVTPEGMITVKGSKGSLDLQLLEGLTGKIEDGKLHILVDKSRFSNSKFHGLYRSLINNMVIGVSEGFEKRLEMIGVGYRAAVSGNRLDIKIGFSHPTTIAIPPGIQVKVEKSTEIIITGIDKHLVGQFAANVRALKKPEPYKGKGIRYKGEYVRKKAGKTAAKGA